MELKPGVNVADITFDDTPHWHTAAWEVLIVLGLLAIVIGFWRGWLNRRRGVSTRKCANAIALASTLVVSSSLINCLFSIADWLDLITAGTLSYRIGCQTLLSIVSGQAKCLGFSIGLATIGIIAYVLLPSGAKKKDNPQPPAGSDR